MNELSIKWNDEKLSLNSERALYVDRIQTLVIGDSHFGKAQYFQKSGIPVNKMAENDDLLRIKKLLNFYRPKLLLFLGDFFHHPSTADIKLLEDLEQKCSIHFIVGNHEGYNNNLNLHSTQSNYLVSGNLCFVHDKNIEVPGKFDGTKNLVSGHIHPVFKFQSALDRFRMPCFAFTKSNLVIPAFGTFTGGFEIKREDYDSIFVIANDRIIKI